MFSRSGIERIRFASPRELVDRLSADVVLIEGFKKHNDWPRVELRRTSPLSIEEALANLDRIWAG